MRHNSALRLIGIGLCLLPFIPVHAENASLLERGAMQPLEWGLGLVITGLLGWLATSLFGWDIRSLFRSAVQLYSRRPHITFCAIVVLLALWLAFLSATIFHHRPVLIDSAVQLFEAKMMTLGHFSLPVTLPEFYLIPNVVLDQNRWYSQYPPGYSLLLSLGVLLRAEWVIDVFLTTLAAATIAAFAYRAYGERVAVLTFVLAAFSLFFCCAGVAFMNHTPTLLFFGLFLLTFSLWEEHASPKYAFFAGLSLAGALVCRPYSAVLFGAPFGFVFLKKNMSEKRWRDLLAMSAGIIPGVLLFLIYNVLTTGDPMLSGYTKLWGAGHGLGFHESPWGVEHTFLRGVIGQLKNVSLLNEFLFETPLPALLPLGAFLVFLPQKQWDTRLLLSFLMLPAGYIFYWHRDVFLGPRYLYEGLAALLPLLAHAIIEIGRLDGKIHPLKLFRPFSAGALFVTVAFLAVMYAAFLGIPARINSYQATFADVSRDVQAELVQRKVDQGIVFVPVSWGARIIAQLRGLGLPADLVERSYQRIDHCVLSEITRSARRGELSQTALVHELGARIDLHEPIVRQPLNNDTSLRLLPGRELLPECVAEIEYDKQHRYTNFLPYFNANSPDLKNDPLFAIDLREDNSRLIAQYPERTITEGWRSQ